MPKEVNLSKLITESICEVDGGWKLLRMSRDSPHVNWSVKSFTDKARAEKSSCHKLILEAVGLHVIHGAFKMEMKAAGWELYRVIINYNS